jgi:flagellar assembly protein FliH
MGAAGQIEIFEYPAGPLPAWDGWQETAEALGGLPVSHGATDDPAREPLGGAFEAGMRAEFEERLAEEKQRAFDSGRERGRLEGREAERVAQAASAAAAEERRMRQAAALVESFARQRAQYLEEVEPEVVKLALAVAARILRREAQMDPLLLTGAVRVALGQLGASTHARMRVPAADLELWTEAINSVPNLAVKPEVLAEEEMRLGDCEIETEMGSVDLGIRAQLSEIERGFFDRAPGPRSRAATGSAATPPAQRAGEERR